MTQMPNNYYLENLAIKLQLEYKELLARSLKILTNNWFQVIEEIEFFWRKNKSLVLCLLHNYFTPWKTYVFTAATYMDYGGRDYLSFLAVGDKHILDDPSCLYMRSYGDMTGEYKSILEDQIKRTLENNYTILNNCDNEIFILPVRYFSEIDQKVLYAKAEQAFCSLFEDIANMRDYFQKIKTFDDLESHLKPKANSKIYFGIDEDDISLSLKERLDIFDKNNKFPLERKNIAQVFLYGIFGLIAQALDVLLNCSEYRLVPFIRNRATFLYLVNFLSIFSDQDDIITITYLTSVAYSIRKSFNRSKFDKITTTLYIKTLKDINFYDNLIADLYPLGISKSSFSISLISKCVEKHLNELYSKINIK